MEYACFTLSEEQVFCLTYLTNGMIKRDDGDGGDVTINNKPWV
jgi:hypothetical protein